MSHAVGTPAPFAGISTGSFQTSGTHQAELVEWVFSQSQVGACLLDPSDRIVRANATWLDAAGVGLSAALGRNLFDLFPSLPEIVSSLHQRVRAGEVIEVQPHRHRIHGRDTWWEGRLSPVPLVEGLGVLIQAWDVTERKRAGDAVARERLLKKAADHFPYLLVIYDAERRFQFVNASATWTVGLSAEDFMGRRDEEVFPPSFTSRYLPALQRAIETCTIQTLELSCPPKMGGRDMLVTYTPLLDEQGRVEHVLGISYDITDRKRVEQALRESEERGRHLADAMPQLVWTAFPDGSVDYYNGRHKEFAGLQQVSDGGRDWMSIVHPDDLAATVDAWRRANEAGAEYEAEHRLRRADGRFYWHVSRAMPIRDAAGRVVKWFGTATDIDALKQAEQALRESDQRKSEFLAMLGHELRNPLAAIDNAIRVMRLRLARGQGIERPLAILDRQVKNSSRLLDDLLDVARLTRGMVHLRKERVRLDAVVASAVESQRALIDGAGHQLFVTLPSKPVILDADPTRMEQVVANLLNNAAKYTPRHGRITLVVERGEGEVTLRVRDDGHGISAELLPRVFDLFVQADRTLDRTHGGLGLGLTLVRDLVTMHGGAVEARSEGMGKGSEFVVRLPAHTEMCELGDRAILPEEPPRAPRRILVVEDNLDSAEMLAEVLMMAGHEIEVVHDGSSAVPAVERFRPEIVLLDIGLPGMDGYEVARRLRAELHEKTPLLVALTGYGQEEDRERSRHAGIAVHLTKPFDLAVIERIVQELQP